MKRVVQINRDFLFLESYVKKLPELFDDFDGLMFQNRNTLKIQSVMGRKIVIKSYGKIYLFNRMMYRFFRESKGKRAYKYSSYLRAQNISTPIPIAYLDCHSTFFFKRGFFVTEYYDYQPIRLVQYMPFEEKKVILNEFADFVKNLHIRRFYHHDFSSGNILFKKVNEKYFFTLVDTNRAEIKNVTPKLGISTLRKLGLSAPDMTYLIEQYSLKRGLNVNRGLTLLFGGRYKMELRSKIKRSLKNLRNQLFGLLNPMPNE